MNRIFKYSFFAVLVMTAVFFSGCSKDNGGNGGGNGVAAPKPPVVSVTDAAGSITSTSATSGGTVSSAVPLSASGVCWATTLQPTIADNFVNAGTATGSFVTNLTGLAPNTLYYVKAYATNESGTTYGPRISFTTLP